jgi:hypothetical protein
MIRPLDTELLPRHQRGCRRGSARSKLEAGANARARNLMRYRRTRGGPAFGPASHGADYFFCGLDAGGTNPFKR